MSRRPVTVVLTFLLVVAVSESSVRAVSDALPDPAPWPSNETEVKAEQLESGNDYAIVFVGTSVTEAAVDPDLVTTLLGRETFNAATPFASQESLRLWVEEFVLSNAHPQLLVVGVPLWSAEFADSTRGGALETGLQQVQEFRHPPNPWVRLARKSALVRWRTELKSIADLLAPANQLGSMGLWTDRGHQTGYYERVAPEMDIELGTRPSQASLDFTSLIELTQAATAEGLQVALLAEPTSCDPRGRCLSVDDLALLRAAYNQVATELGIPYVEVEGPWPKDWYADAAHFNRQGTVVYTTRLVAALKELGL